MRVVVSLTILSLLLVAGVGCSGGGSSDGGVIAPATCVTFQPLAAPTSSWLVTRQGAGSVCGTVVVELVLTGVTDVFTVDFDVSFDATLFRYDGFSLAGSTLTSDGTQVGPVETIGTGQVSLGLTRLGATGIDFTGPGIVVKLIFASRQGTGAEALSFSNTRILGSEQPPLVKTGISWSGGTLSSG